MLVGIRINWTISSESTLMWKCEGYAPSATRGLHTGQGRWPSIEESFVKVNHNLRYMKRTSIWINECLHFEISIILQPEIFFLFYLTATAVLKWTNFHLYWDHTKYFSKYVYSSTISFLVIYPRLVRQHISIIWSEMRKKAIWLRKITLVNNRNLRQSLCTRFESVRKATQAQSKGMSWQVRRQQE